MKKQILSMAPILGMNDTMHTHTVIPVIGMVLSGDNNASTLNQNNFYEPLVIWLAKGKENARAVDSLIKGELRFDLSERKEVANDFYKVKVCRINSFGNLSLQKSVPLEHYIGEQQLYCNQFEAGNLIMVPLNVKEEDEESFILRKTIEVFKKRYPIPTQVEWEDGVFLEIAKTLIKLATIGNVPFKAIYKINYNPELFKTIIIKEYSKYKFKEKFNFVPKLESLLYILDMDKFSSKKWQTFLAGYGGADKFNSLVESDQIGYVNLFECFQENTIELLEIIGEIKVGNISTNTLSKNLLNESFFSSSKAIGMIKSLYRYVEENNKDIFITNTLFVKKMLYILTIEETYLLSSSPKDFYEEIISTRYDSVDPRCGELAIKASQLMLDYQTYLLYENEYLDNIKYIKEDPRYFPLIKGNVTGKSSYTWEIMDMDNPSSWFVGLETNCCQHLQSAGASCIRYSAKNPGTSGAVKVCKDGVTIAQSFFWIDIDKKRFIFDNIEMVSINDGYVATTNQAYKDMVNKMKEFKIFDYRSYNVGMGYSESGLMSGAPSVRNSDMVKLNDVVSKRGSDIVYSDANFNQVEISRDYASRS